MKRRGLLFPTLLTISCTALFLTGAGWFSAGHSSPHPDSRTHAKAQVPLLTEAAWRYRRCQPVHWRAMMLQH